MDRILDHAAGSPTREVCGLLLGDEGRILDVVAAANVAAEPETRFEIDPAILFAAIRAERLGGPRVIGHYHSHPNGIAAPSQRDAADAGDRARLWLVIAKKQTTLWHSGVVTGLHGCFAPLELSIESGCAVA
ncbi:M67 family metallopeptidase [Sphingobium boeckii]|uniref:Proteasome lid subunit RPN8/RPN11 n=1 Tax=Sphingobium boeckii TaxID=1082345 RepID=A0A7W9EFE1_9SPHN|nr:proteasome lid subunit RPN8/RPN11 [Sphingobium boeckii]